jgi:transposase-like protein
MDGLTGFPDAVRAVYPDTHVQRCIVHIVRNSARIFGRAAGENRRFIVV